MPRKILHPQYVTLKIRLDIKAQYSSCEKIYFVYDFLNLLAHNFASKVVSSEQELAVQNPCLRFLKRGCKETLSRIPRNVEILKSKNCSPNICFNSLGSATLCFAYLADQSQIGEIENQ